MYLIKLSRKEVKMLKWRSGWPQLLSYQTSFPSSNTSKKLISTGETSVLADMVLLWTQNSANFLSFIDQKLNENYLQLRCWHHRSWRDANWRCASRIGKRLVRSIEIKAINLSTGLRVCSDTPKTSTTMVASVIATLPHALYSQLSPAASAALAPLDSAELW